MPQLGFDLTKLEYKDRHIAWSGEVLHATVTLQKFKLGNFILKDVKADIRQPVGDKPAGKSEDFEESLLGAPILAMLNFQVEKGYCTLTIPGEPEAERPIVYRSGLSSPSVSKPRLQN